MKLAQLVLTFLLFAFITKPPLAFSLDAEPVIDTSGNPVVAGVEYNVPAIGNGRGGGLILAKTGNSTCPVTVLHTSAPITGAILGTPGTSQGVITTDTPVDIEMAIKPDCVESAKWKVFNDLDIGQAYVGIGGPEDHPGKQLLSGSFRIQRSSAIYKFQFCEPGSTTCLDIGSYDNGEGGDRLVSTDQAEHLQMFFMRAQSTRKIRSVV